MFGGRGDLPRTRAPLGGVTTFRVPMRPLQRIQAFHVVMELHLLQVPGVPGRHRFRRRGGVPQLVAAQIFGSTGIQVCGTLIS